MQVSQSMNVFPSFQLSQDFSLQETFRFHAGNQKKIRENISEIEKTQIIKFTELEIKGPIRHLSPDVFKLTHLTSLFLGGNYLTDLPPEISRLKCLQHLDLSDNKLSSLPPEIGEMIQLKELLLTNNQLRIIPYELGKLFKLQIFNLSGNPLPQEVLQTVNDTNGVPQLITFLLDNLPCTHKPPDREWVRTPNYKDHPEEFNFSVMCYNILSDKYATRQAYGYCPTWALKWGYRRNNIFGEMKESRADIFCLQEVETEQFNIFFLPKLRELGYDGVFTPKSRAKTMQEFDRRFVDGCAIFFNSTKFGLVEKFSVEFNQLAIANSEGADDMLNRVMPKDNVGLVALLKLKSAERMESFKVKDKYLLVSNAHMHWDPEYSDVKLIQAVLFMNELTGIVKGLVEEKNLGYSIGNDPLRSIPMVFCGDFNSLPESSVMEFLLTGRISADHPELKNFGYEGFVTRYCAQMRNGTNEYKHQISHPFSFNSVHDSTFPFTNYTFSFQGKIDYILYSLGHIQPTLYLSPLSEEWIKESKVVGCPNVHVPSDHIPLVAHFEMSLTTN